MDSDLEFDQTQAVVISDLEDDDLTDDLDSSGENEPCGYLRVLPQNDLPGSSYPVYEGDNVIGRHADTCHICISSKSLSKEHACIEIAADSHLIFDKGSRNKTRRGKLILKPEIRYELKHGDVISFADVKCVYEIMKQMSEIVPESDAETDAESDVSESLNLRHDVTDQSDKLIDLTGDQLDSSNRGKTSAQQTLVLSESDSEDDDAANENLVSKRTAVQETLVFESSDDDDSLDLIGMATQAYTKADYGKDNQKPDKPSKMIAETQKYFDQPAEELVETQSFDLDTGNDEEGTACLGDIRSESIGCHVSTAAAKSIQTSHKDSEEHSDDASELFALSTLACDYVVGVDDDGDGSCEEGPSDVVKAVADKNLSADSSTVAVPSDATVAVCSDATVALPSDATVAIPSDATVAIPSDATVAIPSDVSLGIKSPSKRVNKRVLSKSVVSPVRVSSLRLAETLIAEDVVTTSETRPEDSDDMATQIFDETVAVGGSSSQNAAVVSGKKSARYPSDIACSDGATAPVEDVFPVSGKIFAGNRSKAAQKCFSDEPTQVFDVTFDEPTQAFSAVSDEPTQAYGGMSDEPTQAYGFSSDEPTQDYSGISNEPTQIFHDIVGKPTQVRVGISNKPTQIFHDSSDRATQLLNDSTDMATQLLNDSTDMATQQLNDSTDMATELLNDSTEKPTQLLNDASDEPTQVHNDTFDKPTQTFITESDDGDEVIITKKTKSHHNLCHGKDQPATADDSVRAGQQSDKTTEDSSHTPTVGDDNMQGRISDGTVVESHASEEDVDATQAFVDEEEEDDENYAGNAEDPTQKYVMEAEERLEKAADLVNFPKGSTDATSRNHPDSSDDSDLEELSVLKSVETLSDDPAHLFESTSQSHTSLSTNAEPTSRYDMAVDKESTLQYTMAIDKNPALPYDMGVEELPGKAKKRQSPKRKAHIGSEHDGGKELDSSSDTKKESDGTNPCPELSSPVIPLPAKSSLKPALVDRRRSPSPSPGNRHVAFAVTTTDDKVNQHISAGGSANTRQPLQSQKSDQDILGPTRIGRLRNKRSLQNTTAFEQSNDEKSQGEIIKPGQLNLISQIPENLLGAEQSKVGDLELQGQKSDMNAQKTSIRTANRTSTRRSKVQFAAEDVKPVSDTPPLADDVNSVGSTPPTSEDVNPLSSTPPLVEDTSKTSLTPPAGNKRRKISDKQRGDDSTPGKESGSIVVSASKRGRKSVVVIAEEAVEPAEGRRSSARPKKIISYQQLATGVEKKHDKRSAGPSEEAENGGIAALSLVLNSGNKSRKKSAVSLDDSNTAASKKSATSLDDSSNKASKKSAVSLDDSNMVESKKSATSLDDSSNKASKKTAVSLDDSNMAASKKSASLDDRNTKCSRKLATSLNDSNTKDSKTSVAPFDDSYTNYSKKSTTSFDDSNTKASQKPAASLDDSNTKASKKSATSPDDSSNKASKKSAVSLDESNMAASKKSATSLDISSNKASKKSAVSLDESNKAASKKSATSLDVSSNTASKKSASSSEDSNTKARQKPAASMDDSNTKASNKSATSPDDSSNKASKKSALSLDESNMAASKKSATSLDISSNKASKKSAVSLDESNKAASKKSATSLDVSCNKGSKKSATSLDDSSNKASKKSATSLDDSSNKASKKSAASLNDSNTRASRKSAASLNDSNTKDSKISVAAVLNDSNTRASRKSAALSYDSNTNASEKFIHPARKTSVISLDDSKTKDKKHSVKSLASDESNTKASKTSVKSIADSNTTAGEQQNTRRQRRTKILQENTAKKDAKKTSVRNSARPKTEEKDDNDSDETASISSFVDGSTVMDDETPIRVIGDSSEKDHEQRETGMCSERTRKSRTARVSDAKQASRKDDNCGVGSDAVSTTSRKRLHSKDPETDREDHQLGSSSAVAQNEELHLETRRKKRSFIADDPGKDSSSTVVDSTSTHTELDSQLRTVKNVKSRPSKAAKLDANSEALPSMDNNVSKHDNSQENIGSPTVCQEQTNSGTTSRIGTRKSLQVEGKGKGLSQKQAKTQTSNQAVRDTSIKASEVYSKPQIEKIQAPASRGKRATRSVVSSAAAVDCPGSETSQSEFVSSPSQKSTSVRKPAHAAVRPSDIKSRGRKSGRAESMISENYNDKEGRDQNSACEQDKSSQISATEKTTFVHQSPMEKDISSQNATNLKRRTTDNKYNQDSSQSNENKEQIADQISTPRAKKSKQTPVLRTPTGKAHMENADSPVLRKTSANCKPRVMFTGYLDKQGEKIVRDLGGELVTAVQECSHLVTDRICRTVKFLSGLAKGLLIVSPRWLESCKQAGTFVDGHQFLVSDPATEKQYKFNLATSINKAQAGPLLAGYKVHVTRSVKPDPAQMQDILKFAGAQYMKTMPNKSQEKLVVISCTEDESLCQPAVKTGIPVVGAEFILTGILRQEIDLESFSLFQDESKSQKKGKKK